MTASDKDRIHAKIDQMWVDAFARTNRCEDAAQIQFNQDVRSAFGDNEEATQESRIAYRHARLSHLYISIGEAKEIADHNSESDFCFHGLDAQTCPSGCFEGDERYVERD